MPGPNRTAATHRAYQALSRQIGLGEIQFYGRREMLDVVVIDGQARGVVVRNL